MTAEAMRHLQPERGGIFVDCTVGFGGRARDARGWRHARDRNRS
jgi:16S rRNA C1402 N4-methylase RsmH